MNKHETDYGDEVLICADAVNGCRLIEDKDITDRDDVEWCETSEDARQTLDTMGDGETLLRVPGEIAEMIESEYGLQE